MLSSHTVGFQRPDNSNLANLTPGLYSSSITYLRTGLHAELPVNSYHGFDGQDCDYHYLWNQYN